MKTVFLTLAAAALSISSALAQESVEASAVPPSVLVEPPLKPVPATLPPVPNPLPLAFKSEGGSSLQISLYLGLMLAVIVGGFFLLRNGVAIFQPKFKGERKLNISETRMLGNRQFLVVAQYEERKVLLGVCPGRIDYLCTLAGGEPEFPKLAPEGSDA